MKKIIENRVFLFLIVLILVVGSICLAYESANEKGSFLEITISFIGILSGLIGIFSIFINFQVLTKVKNIEEQRLKTISIIKNEIFFRDEITRAKDAIDKLSKRTTKELLEETAIQEIKSIINVCRNPLILDKTKDSVSSVDEMLKYILSTKQMPYNLQEISASKETEFSTTLANVKHILDEYTAANLSDSIIEK